MVVPVIMNKSLEKSEIEPMLKKLFKVRGPVFLNVVAEGTVKNSIIFPQKNSVAFLIQSIEELTTSQGLKSSFDACVIDRVQKFIRLHRNAYVLLTTISPIGFQGVLMEIQKMFLNEDVIFLPCTGIGQCFNILVEVSKTSMNETTIYAKKLSEGVLSENIICDVIEKNMRISQHDAMVVQDGCQTLANLSIASIEQLKDFSLSAETAKKICDFFQSRH